MIIKEEEFLSARRYKELLDIAESSLKTSSLIKELTKDFDKHIDENKKLILKKYIFFKEDQTNIIVLDYSASSLEAFISHLGYIFHDSWFEHEGKNFWKQHPELIDKMNSINIKMPSLPKIDRNKRNSTHHVHPSKHDGHFREDFLCSINPKKDIEQNIKTLHSSWVHVQYDEAKSVFENAISFIKATKIAIEKGILGQTDLAAILKREKLDKDKLREKLLSDFLDDPFKPTILFGNRTLTAK